MVKAILQLYPVIPATSEEERAELRPIGRNRERYQALLPGMHELVRLADDLGFWGVSTIEHHFHSEGYEVGPSPGIFNGYWAAITRRIRIGALGYVMSAHNPIRVAEETAILSHLTQGRYFVGFTRGYQARWTNVLGQHLGARATLSPSSMPDDYTQRFGAEHVEKMRADDQLNREIFEEQLELVLRAWSEDSIRHQSALWEIPHPYDAGIDWKMPATRELGAEGEMDENGRVQRISVVPAPYQVEYPPIFIPAMGSPQTLAYAATRGFNLMYYLPIKRAAEYAQVYLDEARLGGRDVVYGENAALSRMLQIGETTEEARQMVADYDVEISRNLYDALIPMGYDDGNAVDSIIASGLWCAGSVSEVRDQLVEQWKQLPAEYIVIISHYAQQPLESARRCLELFMREVKPALDEVASVAVTRG